VTKYCAVDSIDPESDCNGTELNTVLSECTVYIIIVIALSTGKYINWP
jgi:hypothetical protein